MSEKDELMEPHETVPHVELETTGRESEREIEKKRERETVKERH